MTISSQTDQQARSTPTSGTTKIVFELLKTLHDLLPRLERAITEATIMVRETGEEGRRAADADAQRSQDLLAEVRASGERTTQEIQALRAEMVGPLRKQSGALERLVELREQQALREVGEETHKKALREIELKSAQAWAEAKVTILKAVVGLIVLAIGAVGVWIGVT